MTIQDDSYVETKEEETEDLRAACCMHAHAVALARSPVFQSVAANAERQVRKASYANAPTIDCEYPGEFDDSYAGW